jgi:serine/threonine protein kinase
VHIAVARKSRPLHGVVAQTSGQSTHALQPAQRNATGMSVAPTAVTDYAQALAAAAAVRETDQRRVGSAGLLMIESPAVASAGGAGSSAALVSSTGSRRGSGGLPGAGGDSGDTRAATVAVKRIPVASGRDMSAALQETDMLDAVRGMRSALQLEAVFAGPTEVSLVTEFMAGGHLMTRLVDMGAYSEGVAAAVVAAITRSVAVLHAAGIIHRDLHPDTLQLRHPSSACWDVVIGGLASATRCNADGNHPHLPAALTQRCGFWPYMAPEVARLPASGNALPANGYGAGVDVW